MNTLQQQAEAITQYLTEMELTQAVLINGEWGVGKSFFVRETLKKQLEAKGLTVIFSSLYGINSLEAVREDLIYSILESKLEKVELKGKKIPSFLLKKFPSLVKIAARHFEIEEDNASDISDLINIDFNNIVLVFDDLERAGLDINIVLGFINNYVENTEAKVIIIANEDEIGSSKLSLDLPQKYLVAACPSIQVPYNNNDNSSKNRSKSNSFTYKQLVDRTHFLFSNDIRYATIKEKLIGLTVKINLNYSDIFDKLIKNYAHGSAQKELERIKFEAISLFEDLKCRNLRTIIFCVIVFNKIYESLSGLY
ncbi:MAG: KAP family NTPase, partial [Oscillospiraceae bacterium]|nr:KAP family NTPase [Oscillospiraceae bacterium]